MQLINFITFTFILSLISFSSSPVLFSHSLLVTVFPYFFFSLLFHSIFNSLFITILSIFFLFTHFLRQLLFYFPSSPTSDSPLRKSEKKNLCHFPNTLHKLQSACESLHGQGSIRKGSAVVKCIKINFPLSSSVISLPFSFLFPFSSFNLAFALPLPSSALFKQLNK